MSHYSEEWLAERLAKKGQVKAENAPSPRVGPDSQRQVRASRRDYKAELLQQLALVGIKVEPEFKIFSARRFRADWRVTETRVLIEFEGGLFHKGKMGHDSVTGILRDIEKHNLCAIAGWTVIRVAPNHVVSGIALNWIQTAVERDPHVPEYRVATSRRK